MFDNIVTYHIHRDTSLPPNNALAYQYVLAAGGIYLRAANRFFDVLLPLGRSPIRGLAPLQLHFRLKTSRLPGRLLGTVLADAQRARRRDGGLKEALYHFKHDGARVRVLKPPQRATAASVMAIEGDAADIILDLHSHGNMSAFWSGTDNGDEQGFRVYGVLGRLDTAPEIRLRLGIYGYWFPLPIHMLFDGSGGFVDVLSQKMPRGTSHAAA
jgi:PRTRC genetic system protein A